MDKLDEVVAEMFEEVKKLRYSPKDRVLARNIHPKEPISTHISPYYLEYINRLVEKGLYASRAEFIRIAVYNELKSFINIGKSRIEISYET